MRRRLTEIERENLSILFGASLFRAARVRLNNAQIKALPTTGVDIVLAPGAGQVIIPVLSICLHNWVANYTNIDAAAKLGLQMTPATGYVLGPLREAEGASVSGVLAAGAEAYGRLAPLDTSILGADTAEFGVVADLANQAVVLSATNGAAGAFTGGNAANTLDVIVYYQLLSL
jgi:hypothetical protein